MWKGHLSPTFWAGVPADVLLVDVRFTPKKRPNPEKAGGTTPEAI